MISCETANLRAAITPRINEALDALLSLQDIFSNETMSYAIGEVSEQLVKAYTGGERTKRANRGHDLTVGVEKIEVKARFVGKYKEDVVHFNFGLHSRS